MAEETQTGEYPAAGTPLEDFTIVPRRHYGAWIGTVLALMRDQGIRRVPVTSADGVLVGLLTFDDLVAALTLQTQAMTEALVVGRQREGDVHP